jgi:uncharacterized damage-inducible protein DinB
VSADTTYIDRNARETGRLRALVESLGDAALQRIVHADWTVAAVLGHMAFWDARALWLADKVERGEPFGPGDAEPEDVTWINDATRQLIQAFPRREVAQMALRLAEAIDARVASLPPERVWPNDPDSLLNAFRAEHRAEHLDEIEAALTS